MNTQKNQAAWLMKTEPSTYAISDLQRDGSTEWDGVRNYQARNFMRDEMREGDDVFIYHSNIATPAIVGMAVVCSSPYPDETQFDTSSEYFDEKASREVPRWFLVDICFSCICDEPITRDEIKQDDRLADLLVVQKRGSRLSIQPVALHHASALKQRCRGA
jgi:predicted RNA-binding protein with PUA-like domain